MSSSGRAFSLRAVLRRGAAGTREARRAEGYGRRSSEQMRRKMIQAVSKLSKNPIQPRRRGPLAS